MDDMVAGNEPINRMQQHVAASTTPIGKTERDELARLVRSRVKVSKADVAQREAELRADTERQLSEIFEPLDEAWAHITKEAGERVQEWQAEIARLCRERGVKESFQPKLGLSWAGRGENADATRRAELRRLAYAKVAEAGKTAIAAIEKAAAETVEQLFLSGAPSEEARGFLAAMPTVQQLMPPVAIRELGPEAAPGIRRELGEARRWDHLMSGG